MTVTTAPFLLDDVVALRADVLALRPEHGRRYDLWITLRDSARRAPHDFGWFVPFVATITRDPDDIARARQVIDAYLAKLDPITFSTGLQFHFWCYAFPHAKVALYVQWLCAIGAYSDEEARAIEERLVEYHFVNFYYGMRGKPEPECVDNQALSLVLSSTIVGYLFSRPDRPSRMAEIMLRDGLRRLPAMLSAMPASGYTGEGSDYMNCVVGPAVPLAVEVLERVGGYRDVLEVPLEPGGARPASVLRMVARSFMPGGLLLPWDNYGYQFGVRSTLAYGARRLGDDLFFRVLEDEVIWTYDIGIGWAYDDLVWTLIWWPSEQPPERETAWRNWYEPDVGAAFASDDGARYVMQMWDASEPVHPARSHVNPNAVLFNGYRVPISADGSPTEGTEHRFQFGDSWREVSFMAIDSQTRYNFGDGCAGAHSVVLLDGHEGMRAHDAYPQVSATAHHPADGVWADVTPIYRENFPDVEEVSRRTQLHPRGLVTIVDRVRATHPHRVTSRFVVRPEVELIEGGARVRTPEGVTLQLVDVDARSTVSVDRADHVPGKPDDGSRLIDFTSAGAEVERVVVGLVSREFETDSPIDAVAVVPDLGASLDYGTAMDALRASTVHVKLQLPAYLEADLPATERWWYRVEIEKRRGPAWLRLPVGMHDPFLWIDGDPVSLGPFRISGELIAPRVRIPERLDARDRVEVVLRVNVPRGHYDGQGWGTIGMTGGMGIGYPVAEERIRSVTRNGSSIRVITNQDAYDLRIGAGSHG